MSGHAEAVAGAEVAATSEGEQVMELLSEHVPLSLIMDLATPAGPPSAEILAEEGVPDAEWWAQG